MKHLKLFEDYNNEIKYDIRRLILSDNLFSFSLNSIRFTIDIVESKLIKYFFIDINSPMFSYIKSDKFIDDLQVELFKKDIMDYSADEIQWIIKKDGLYKNQLVVDYIEEKLSDLVVSPDYYIECYRNSDGTLIFTYNKSDEYVSMCETSFGDDILKKLGLTVMEAEYIILPYITEKFNIKIRRISTFNLLSD